MLKLPIRCPFSCSLSSKLPFCYTNNFFSFILVNTNFYVNKVYIFEFSLVSFYLVFVLIFRKRNEILVVVRLFLKITSFVSFKTFRFVFVNTPIPINLPASKSFFFQSYTFQPGTDLRGFRAPMEPLGSTRGSRRTPCGFRLNEFLNCLFVKLKIGNIYYQ